MNFPEQTLAELHQLLLKDPGNGVQKVRRLLNDLNLENILASDNAEKQKWIPLMLTYSDIIRQMIRTFGDLEEAVDIIETTTMLCSKETSAFDRGVIHCIRGKLYMNHISDFTNL